MFHLRKTKKIKHGQPTKGWSNKKPGTHQRTIMLKKCGRKCFLGPKKSFPICNKGTCRINPKGVYSAYIRAKEWGNAKSTYKTFKPRYVRKTYKNIQDKAKRILCRFGYKNVGANSKRNK
jgi:hypothetical protein